MATEVTMVVVTTVTAGMLGVAINQVSDRRYWYDFLNDYFVYDSQYTPIIDDILMNGDGKHTKIGTYRITSGTQRIPGEGFHYYYTFGKSHREYTFEAMFEKRGWAYKKASYIGMEKIFPSDGKPEYYVVWKSPLDSGKRTHELFESEILRPSEGQIRVVSIDVSRDQPGLVWLTKMCQPPFPRQIEAMDYILEKWNSENNFNRKVFIHGKRGVGKSYTAMLLKKEIDRRYHNTNCRLYDDFDPTTIGVNIQTMALRYATKTSPIIIVIDEIDTIYEHVFLEKNEYDNRIQHTKSRKTFHTMLDNFGNYKYVIVVFTSEFSPDELVRKNELHKSFLRPGRVDMFLNMTEENCFINRT